MSVPIIVTQPPADGGDDDRGTQTGLTITVDYNPPGGLTPQEEARDRAKITRLSAKFYAKLLAKLGGEPE